MSVSALRGKSFLSCKSLVFHLNADTLNNFQDNNGILYNDLLKESKKQKTQKIKLHLLLSIIHEGSDNFSSQKKLILF